jgi:hypothetical protein
LIPKKLQPCAQVNHKLVFKITYQVKTSFWFGFYYLKKPKVEKPKVSQQHTNKIFIATLACTSNIALTYTYTFYLIL